MNPGGRKASAHRSGLVEREMVRTDAALVALCEELRAAGRFAMDTEFFGEHTYVPRLCLVQIATAEFVVIVDPLVCRDLSPLWELVADPAVEKVVHAGREDLRLAYYNGGKRLPASIFDTQIAAGLVGLQPYPLGYGRLVQTLLRVKLSKSETRSDWDRRPLSNDQLRYAEDDVRYLFPVAERLHAMLDAAKRGDWAAEEMGRYSEATLYEPDPDAAYLRMRGSRRGFAARPTALLRALAAWREREAAERNMPVRVILSDEALAQLALHPPRRLDDLYHIRGFPSGDETAYWPGITRALAAGRAIPEAELPEALGETNDERSPEERARGDVLYALGVALCLQRDLSPELVLSRADSAALLTGGDTGPLSRGWRKEALGHEMQRFAAGDVTAALRSLPHRMEIQFREE